MQQGRGKLLALCRHDQWVNASKYTLTTTVPLCAVLCARWLLDSMHLSQKLEFRREKEPQDGHVSSLSRQPHTSRHGLVTSSGQSMKTTTAAFSATSMGLER